MNPRPHPLGLENHPEWDGVWDRYFAQADAVEVEAANDDEPPTEPFPTGPVLFGVTLCLVITAVLVGALVQ